MRPKNPPLIVGLAAPGLLWLATSVAPGQDLPTAPPGPPIPAPKASSPTSKSFRALLLSNGKVVRGEIVEDAPAGLFRLRQKGGAIGYPKIMVLKAGQSIEELYQFQVARLPGGDSEERMKLARWCLTEKLTAQAKEQLEAIQAANPDDAVVNNMLFNLAAAGDQQRPQVDAEVRQTSAEMPRGEAPTPLDPRVLGKLQRRFNALPEIFELPQAQAVKRANEFFEYVHPVLQQSCAKCHNEKYRGDFQLVEAKARRDLMNSDVARANLDATLRLINPDDPARSELLSAGLVPHGGSSNAVFRGPNDRSYQVLNLWAKSLKPGKGGANPARGTGDGVTQTGFAPADNAQQGGGFGSDRPGRKSATPGLPALPQGGGAASPSGLPMPTPRVNVEQYDEDATFLNAPGERPEFLTPYKAGEATYKAGGPSNPRPGQARAKGAAPKSPANPANAQASAPKKAVQVAPGAVVVTTDDPNDLPGMDQPRYPPKAESGDAPKKTKAIDNALLEKMMRNRNGGTP